MLKRILMILIAFMLLSAWPVFAVGPMVPVVGSYCLDKNSESDLAGYRIYLGLTNDLSDAVMSDFPLAQMSADDQGDSTRTCATRDQTGQALGQYYVAATAYDTSGNESPPGEIVPFELIIPDGIPPIAPTNLSVR